MLFYGCMRERERERETERNRLTITHPSLVSVLPCRTCNKKGRCCSSRVLMHLLCDAPVPAAGWLGEEEDWEGDLGDAETTIEVKVPLITSPRLPWGCFRWRDVHSQPSGGRH